MKRSLNEKARFFFVNMGRRNKFLRIPAIVGLAVSMLMHRIYMYFKTGTKRFVCTAFILMCFMVGNSFAYPEFQAEYDQTKVLEEEDIAGGYSDEEFHNIENVDKYL